MAVPDHHARRELVNDDGCSQLQWWATQAMMLMMMTAVSIASPELPGTAGLVCCC
jgi:hypothetical protein